MQSLEQLARNSITNDLTPYFNKCLHELPLPLLDKLLPAMSPCQLVAVEKKYGKGLDTSGAWRGLCENLRYISKRRQPWESPLHWKNVPRYWRTQFFRHYVSVYLLPFLSHWPSQDPELQPTDRTFCTQSNHIYNRTRPQGEGETPLLNFQSFLDHLNTVLGLTEEISIRMTAVRHILMQPRLVETISSQLKVLKIIEAKDESLPALFTLLQEVIPHGNLRSLILVGSDRLTSDDLNRLLYMCSGCLTCLACKAAHANSLGPSAKDMSNTENKQACAGGEELLDDCSVDACFSCGPSCSHTECDVNTYQAPYTSLKIHKNADRHSCESSAKSAEFSSKPADSSGTSADSSTKTAEFDLFDAALMAVSSEETSADSKALAGSLEQEKEGETGQRCSQNETRQTLFRPPAECVHTDGLESITLTTTEHTACSASTNPVLPVLHSWLPSWGALKHLVVPFSSTSEGLGLQSYSSLLDKIHDGQLLGLALSFSEDCEQVEQVVGDVVQALAQRDTSRKEPMQVLGFLGPDAFDGNLHMADAAAFSGVHSVCLHDLTRTGRFAGESLLRYLTKDQSRRRLSVTQCTDTFWDLTFILLGNNIQDTVAPLLNESFPTSPDIQDHHSVFSSEICELIKSLRHLEYLDISRNDMGHLLGQFVPEIVYPGSPLKMLNISNTRLKEDEVHRLADHLIRTHSQHLPLLDTLTVSGLCSTYMSDERPTVMDKLRRIAQYVRVEVDRDYDRNPEYLAQM